MMIVAGAWCLVSVLGVGAGVGGDAGVLVLMLVLLVVDLPRPHLPLQNHLLPLQLRVVQLMGANVSAIQEDGTR